MVQNNTWSSVAYATQANLPNYPPPEASSLQASNIRGSSPFYDSNPPAMSPAGHNAPVVSKRPRLNGMRFLYSYGAQLQSWFRMRATGQAESSKFQQFLSHEYNGSFNDYLFRPGGYPQNFGLTFKVSSVPQGIATSAAWGRMEARPQYTRNIYTNRSYSTMPSVPAIPTYGTGRS